MIKVLIVDDSLLVRKILNEILSKDPMIEVVGMAEDPYDARGKIKTLKPDVITLDVEMPKMNGLQFLSNLMRLHPLPVIMISTLTAEGADVTLRALELGAVDFICKPKINVKNELEQYANEVIAKIKDAATSKPRAITTSNKAPLVNSNHTKSNLSTIKAQSHVIGIGSSTGGIEALNEIIPALNVDLPGIVISQHIPQAFCERFTNRMNNSVHQTVQLAEDQMPIKPGHVYVAPGDKHLLIKKNSSGFYCQLDDGPKVSGHKPSVDVMFDTIAKSAGKNAIGIILTGMGNDGASGLKKMRSVGANTIAQDEMTSVVWGMPGSAVKADAAEDIVALGKIAEVVNERVNKKLVKSSKNAA